MGDTALCGMQSAQERVRVLCAHICSSEDPTLAIVITGAGSGIGRATAEHFALHGYNVVCADLNQASAEESAAEINALEEATGRAVAIAADVSVEVDVKATVDLSVKEFGRLDAYFANAGLMTRYRPIEETTEEDFMRTLRVNTLGPFFAIKHASPVISQNEDGGAIVCTASIAAIRADITPLEYAASKGALVSLVRSSADRLLGTGVRVNAVAPGGVVTAITTQVAMEMDSRGESLKGYDHEAFPPADPEQVAQVVRFLASEQSSFVNGQVIVADGGMSNSMGFRLVKKRKNRPNIFEKGM